VRLYVGSWKNGNAPGSCCRPRRTYLASLHNCKILGSCGSAALDAPRASLASSGLLLVGCTLYAPCGRFGDHKSQLGGRMAVSFRTFGLIHCKGDVPNRWLCAARGSTRVLRRPRKRFEEFSKARREETLNTATEKRNVQNSSYYPSTKKQRITFSTSNMCTSIAGCSFGLHQRPGRKRVPCVGTMRARGIYTRSSKWLALS
jgi:hypothetical protein